LILSNNTAVCFFKCVFECVTLFVLSDSVLLCWWNHYILPSAALCFLVSTFICEGVKPSAMSAYLEITDVINKHLRYVPVPAYVFSLVIFVTVCS